MSRLLLYLIFAFFANFLNSQTVVTETIDYNPFLDNFRYATAGTVSLDNGNFLVGLSKTDTISGDLNLYFAELNVQGELIAENEIREPATQRMNHLLKLPDGEIWSLAAVDMPSDDNHRDLQLARISESLEPELIFTLDEGPYDGFFPTVVADDQRIAIVNKKTNELLVVDLIAREVTRRIALIESELLSTIFASNGEGQVVVITVDESDASLRLTAYDINEGEIDWSVNFLPSTDCTWMGDYSSVGLYHPSRNSYLLPDNCLNFYEIGTDGTVDFFESQSNYELDVFGWSSVL